MKKKQNVPPMRPLEVNVADLKGDFVLVDKGFEVASWRPGPVGSGPPTQVHISIPIAEGMTAVVRLKSARAVDELVGVLLEHRNHVWPGDKS